MSGRGSKPPVTSWLVEYHYSAVEEFAALKDAQQRKGVLKMADLLRQLGPKMKEPHMKPVQGSGKLRELRPGGGKTLVRPLYFRLDERTFKILALAPEAQVDKSGFNAAVDRATKRAKADYDVDV